MALLTNDDPDQHTRSPILRFFAVALDPHAYGALLYMVLALALGIGYFVWVTVGISLSIGFMILIIGIPFALLFLMSVRALSFLEAHIVRFLLGADIPQSEPMSFEDSPIWGRIKYLLTDYHTWTSVLYLAFMLALGVIYFSTAVVALSLIAGLAVGPTLQAFFGESYIHIDTDSHEMIATWIESTSASPVGMVLMTVVGILLFFVTLHAAKGIGWLHSRMAEKLLVRI